MVTLSNLEEVVKRLPYHPVDAIKRGANEVVLELLSNS